MFLALSWDKNSQSKQLVSELQRCSKKQSTTFPAFEVPWIAASPANSFYCTSPGLFGWPSDPSQTFCSTREGQIHRFPLSPCSLPRLLRITASFLLKDFNKLTFSSIGRVMKNKYWKSISKCFALWTTQENISANPALKHICHMFGVTISLCSKQGLTSNRLSLQENCNSQFFFPKYTENVFLDQNWLTVPA